MNDVDRTLANDASIQICGFGIEELLAIRAGLAREGALDRFSDTARLLARAHAAEAQLRQIIRALPHDWHEQYKRAERAEAEVERLSRWKAEATEVMDGLDDLGDVLALPLGVRVTGQQAVDRACQLVAVHGSALATMARVRALVSDWQANGNSRPLGDPTADTWHEAALQLLTVLDGGE